MHRRRSSRENHQTAHRSAGCVEDDLLAMFARAAIRCAMLRVAPYLVA
jgi:hypothetical protein